MWTEYRKRLTYVLDGLVVTTGSGEEISVEDGFARWTAKAIGLAHGCSLHFIGNGASASMASHFSADITKNCGIRANVFTDAALITALGNDNGFENAFSTALNRYGLKGDLLIAISSSGMSANVVNACLEAARLGIDSVTITAKQSGNQTRRLGSLNFYVPAESFSLAESAHAVLLHHWTDRLETAHMRNSKVLQS